VSLLKRFLGIGAEPGTDAAGHGETSSVRRITAQLDRMPADQARYLAAFAYVLARVAHADLRLEDSEVEAMREMVASLGELPDDEAALVCELACDQSARLGGSENYVVTREFRRIATPLQRTRLLECLFAVAAADGEISTTESHEVLAIAEELGFTRRQALGVRSQFREHLAELRSRTGG
jgi:uncharacterized tellurite resistance protein B-like protein